MKNKKLSPLSICALTASVLVSLYYFVYLELCIVGFDSRLMSFFALFVIACVTLPILFHEHLKRILKGAYKPLKLIFTVLLCLYAVSVAVFWCYIGNFSSSTPETYAKAAAETNDTGEGTAVLVFGCRAYGNRPSLTLRIRLDAALELLCALPDAVCIVSGGQGSNETVPEAVVMQSYLTEHGISEDRIIMESASHSTSENIRLTKELMEETGLSYDRVIGVSTAFHLSRIKLLSERYDFPMELCSSPSPSFGHMYVSMVREYLSYIKMLLFDKAVIITKVT